MAQWLVAQFGHWCWGSSSSEPNPGNVSDTYTFTYTFYKSLAYLSTQASRASRIGNALKKKKIAGPRQISIKFNWKWSFLQKTTSPKKPILKKQ